MNQEIDSERGPFERYMLNEIGWPRYALARQGDGYDNHTAAIAWGAWQARAQQQQRNDLAQYHDCQPCGRASCVGCQPQLAAEAVMNAAFEIASKILAINPDETLAYIYADAVLRVVRPQQRQMGELELESLVDDVTAEFGIEGAAFRLALVRNILAHIGGA